ncbi:MAG: hypothetical protein NTX24_02425 [Candidatus Pacearchaeota archaeon]|nr:hypothetical protein [Candidatus Pacearchaeota archaeon]
MNDVPSDMKHTRTPGRRDLAGRLVRVQVLGAFRNENAAGVVADGDKVLVKYGGLTRDPRLVCLARFDSMAGTTRGNFVSSSVPHYSRKLVPEKYILYGQWKRWMEKRERFPTFEEVNQYFDPGHFGWIIYLSETLGPFAIYGDESRSLGHLSYGQIIRGEFPDPRKASRVVLAESMVHLDDFITEIKNHRLYPIKLDNLEENRRALRSETILRRIENAQA